MVRINTAGGYTIDSVLAAFPVTLRSTVLASRKVYLVEAADTVHGPQLKELIDRIAASPAVSYAEPDSEVNLADTRFQAWTDGPASRATAAQFAAQSLTGYLSLASVHTTARGAGAVVAVLDTGMQKNHPALRGPTAAGWDYVDDDANTADVAHATDSNGDGIIDSALGHGTFVTGMIRLVAPEATILPERVLDSDGHGTVFVIAQAIQDAVASGATIINLSFGSPDDVDSRLLDDSISAARARGVTVVAAAGNSGTEETEYPAARPEVLSVGALAGADFSCLAGFSTRGSWVDVAAPGDQVVGPVPGRRYATWSGTSVAAPLVAGQLAILASSAPGTSAQRLVQAVQNSARRSAQVPVRYGAIDMLESLRQLQGPGGPRSRP